MIDTQLLIIFYKNELKKEPDCLAYKALLERSRNRLQKLKEEK